MSTTVSDAGAVSRPSTSACSPASTPTSSWRTPAIIILGYIAQYAVLPMRMTSAILERIPPSLEQAAQLCGASWFMTLRQIVAPLGKRGLITVWAVGYVFWGFA